MIQYNLKAAYFRKIDYMTCKTHATTANHLCITDILTC